MNHSTATTTTGMAARPRTDEEPGRSARAARRWVLILAPTVAGLLAIGGAVADPAVDLEGRALYELYAANPEPLQWKSVLYHFAYAVWGLAALMLVGAVRRRGSWLANVAGLLAFLGISSLPGFLLADFYDSAIGQVHGVDGAVAVEQAMGDMWGLGVMGFTGIVGFLLCLPVAVLAAWRAGLLRWWAALAPIAGLAAGFFFLGANVPGWAVTTVGFVVLSVGLARAGRDPEQVPDEPARNPGRPSRAVPLDA
ncbi:hypothetical protein FHU33_3968 [Blastococcus colisei]|uniref:DUF4386 family protein n=1 Tax=Blastococcus colisei TaxID=1564162 RepID=A0A543NZP6_9ACTN|nr:hypothetical protein [Blastococcus colisei]TQN37322.1 hypothetical protein FHU33_3968 [Blastococcus colisei]